jgi:calcium-dependent protein kinase
MQKLFKAVAHIHSKGIAHRDIKPENIIWSRDPKDECRFKLIDFGLAHKFAKNKEVQTGMIVGTPLYLAPEAFDGISTMEADIWGCGVLLCVMLSGSYPCVGNNISELRKAI